MIINSSSNNSDNNSNNGIIRGTRAKLEKN